MIFLDSKLRMPLMKLPVRSVVIPVKGGRVLLSPGSRLTAAELSAAGPITDLVAPSLLHCAGMPLAMSVFPKAQRWGAPGAREVKPEIPWTGIASEASWPYRDELDVKLLQGLPRLNEMVFYHAESKTLFVTDLIFNLANAKGFGARVILGLFGTYRRFAVSRFFMGMVKDEAAFATSLREVLKWPFENVVMAHGDAVNGKGREMFLAALKERKIEI